MKLAQRIWTRGTWNAPLPSEMDSPNTLCLLFFSPEMDTTAALKDLTTTFPKAEKAGCSGAGEIAGEAVMDGSAILTIARFETAQVKAFKQTFAAGENSKQLGEKLAKQIPTANLKAVYVLSEGININGTELVAGLTGSLPDTVLISGGLAGDGTRFQKTRLLFQNKVVEGGVGAIAFYGNSLFIGSEANAGWLPFGPERTITKSKANVLYELDGRPALALYKEYLGKEAEKLPASGLLFPLVLGKKDDASAREIVRTVLAVDEAAQSMTFAGDMPQGETARFMRVTDSSLIGAAENAAQSIRKTIAPDSPTLSLVVSCVGRRLVLGSSTEDEVEAVFAKLPAGSIQTGFYSYGELAPGKQGFCDLHNQTCTLTWIQEKKAA